MDLPAGAVDPATGQIIGIAVLRWDPNTGILGYSLMQSSAEAERIAQTGEWARKQVDKNYEACKKELGKSPEPGKKQAADILAVSQLEGIDETLRAGTWSSKGGFAKDGSGFEYYPTANYRPHCKDPQKPDH